MASLADEAAVAVVFPWRGVSLPIAYFYQAVRRIVAIRGVQQAVAVLFQPVAPLIVDVAAKFAVCIALFTPYSLQAIKWVIVVLVKGLKVGISAQFTYGPAPIVTRQPLPKDQLAMLVEAFQACERSI